MDIGLDGWFLEIIVLLHMLLIAYAFYILKAKGVLKNI